MSVKKIFEKRTGRTFLTIEQSYREPGTGQVKQKTIKSLRCLDKLEKEFDDPIAHFKRIAKQMTDESKVANGP